jgi:hypothetical protein
VAGDMQNQSYPSGSDRGEERSRSHFAHSRKADSHRQATIAQFEKRVQILASGQMIFALENRTGMRTVKFDGV